MEKENNNITQENDMEELDLNQLDKAAGGRGLRDIEKVETQDIDANTIARI